MTKTVSAAEAKNRFGAMMEVVREGENVIVQRHGKPEMVMIAYDAYQETEEIRRQKQRADALARLDELGDKISERNKDLSEEEAIALAVQISRELFEDMVARGDISFERDRHRP